MTTDMLGRLPAALISWYDFKINAKALYIEGGDSAFEVLFDILRDKELEVTKVPFWELDTVQGKFDYIVMADVLERCKEPVQFLKQIKGLLSAEGKLLCGADNRFAIRYFCGDKDIYSGHVLDGIDNYRKVSNVRLEKIGGHSFAKYEMEKFLEAAGFLHTKFYSCMPSIKRPQVLLSYGYKPNEALDIRVFPQYKSPSTIYMEEELLYAPLLENDMFHQMANGYFIECSLDGVLCDADQITVQGDRCEVEAMATIIKKGKYVKKKALYQKGMPKVKALAEREEDLKANQIPIVSAKIEKDCYVMPYVDGEIATLHFRDSLRQSKECFLKEILEWKSMIEHSSEHVPYEKINWLQFEPGWEKRKADDPNLHKWEQLAFGTEEEKNNIGVILKRGYVDMVSLNCFYTKDGFQFFDQEFYIENFPANAILIRTIDFIYRDCSEMELLYPREELLKELGLYEHQNIWRRKVNDFLSILRNEKELTAYHRKVRRDYRLVQENRHRMDYPQEEYERLFKNIFKGVENKKIYLFGSGKYSEQFIEQFGQYYDIAGVVDNNTEKWGTEFYGVEIMSPAVLKQIDVPFKVFICIKFFEDVLEQLKEMEIKDISIYDPRLDYERPVQIVCKEENSEPKKYHIGYVAGVFDLFHKGHLNLLRRAKEQCDYLIVGVVSDEQVIESKKTRPYISFEERREIVEACRYVDEAVKIPMDKRNTEDAWRMYHFDVQFSGSDYEKEPFWMGQKTFLQQHGSDLVFFPYTESTSSTMLKEKISKG